MVNTRSKKQLILELAGTRKLERAGDPELRGIQAELRRTLGKSGRISLSYIANVLAESGMRVESRNRFVNPWMEEPYASRLRDSLHFHDLDTAEGALRRLDQAYREYRAASDLKGAELVRALVVKGRLRAEGLMASPRVGLGKRREKQEIALWFKVWLDLPEAFFDWLQLRKNSPEFQNEFRGPNP